MSMGRRKLKQRSLFLQTSEQPEVPRHRFYEALNALLKEAGFDAHVEALCEKYYEQQGTIGRRSIEPGVYFRMLLIGYFEGVESERGICWRCADSLSLKAFLGFEVQEAVPDHSTLSLTRTRLEESVFHEAFRFVLRILNERGLLRGKVAGVDSTYLRADASMKGIVRRDSGEGYKAYLRRLSKAAGFEEATDEELRRFDRKRKGKRMSNEEWVSPVDSDAEIMRLKDGRTRLAYKAEHVVDMETGAVMAAELLPATSSDSGTLIASLDAAQDNIDRAREDSESQSNDEDDDGPVQGNESGSHSDAPKIQEVVGDKGYHKAETLCELKGDAIRAYIPEPEIRGNRHWSDKGGRATAVAVYENRARVKRRKSKKLQRRRGELLERTFAHACETGGHRRLRLRGRENAWKRYLIHLAGFNLGLVMRAKLGSGTPRGLADAATALRSLYVALRALLATVLADSSTRIDSTTTPGSMPLATLLMA